MMTLQYEYCDDLNRLIALSCSLCFHFPIEVEGVWQGLWTRGLALGLGFCCVVAATDLTVSEQF